MVVVGIVLLIAWKHSYDCTYFIRGNRARAVFLLQI